MTQASWDPAQYLRHGAARARPARDLLAAVPLAEVRRAVDLGCGAGLAARLITRRWPHAGVVAIDRSPAMLEQARAESAKTGNSIDWQRGDIASWRAEAPLDLIVSNAALNWLDDHPALFARLIDQLRPGGVLAVQMPDNYAAPSHQLLYETARAPRWQSRLAALALAAPVLPLRAYHDLLAPRCAALDLWASDYLHRLEGEDPVLDWVSGSVLRPFLDALEAGERAAFAADYSARLRRAYPAGPDGVTLFPFRRIFIVATRTAT